MNEDKYHVLVKLTKANGEDGRTVSVSLSRVARQLTLEQFFQVVDDWLNCFGYFADKRGNEFGKLACATHPTLQGLLINFMVAIIKELATKKYTDARNEYAIATCRKIAAILDDKDHQPFI